MGIREMPDRPETNLGWSKPLRSISVKFGLRSNRRSEEIFCSKKEVLSLKIGLLWERICDRPYPA